MTPVELLAGLGVFLGAMLQSAVGFGFGLVSAPLLFAAFGPLQGVAIENGLALIVNGISLMGEGRRPAPLRRLATVVLACSAPGMLAGVLILRSVDGRLLQVALTVTVFVALAMRLSAARGGMAVRPAPGWAAPATGVTTGVLTTTISTAGPPLVLLLLGRGHAPARVRDTLATVFIAQSVMAVAALAVTGTEGAVPEPATVAVLAGLSLTGQLLGRPLFGRLAEHGHYERLLTGVLVLSAGIGLVTVLA